MWIIFSLVSALLTGIISTTAKGVDKQVDSTLGFGVQAVVMMIMSWLVIGVQGKGGDLVNIDAKSWGWLVLTGLISTVAYLFYFGALKTGPASAVAPLDRLSLIFAIGFAGLFLREKITPPIIFGGGLMVVGAIIIAVSSKGAK
jgi:transporter family protein